MFNILYWSCGIRHVLIKRAPPLHLNCNYLVQTKCIVRKNGGGPSRGKRAGALALRPPLAPERDAVSGLQWVVENLIVGPFAPYLSPVGTELLQQNLPDI